jgi:hypothetical protein
MTDEMGAFRTGLVAESKACGVITVDEDEAFETLIFRTESLLARCISLLAR